MGNFRKSKKKVQKKKKTKKSSKDTDWDFDGGVGFTTVDEDAPAPRRKRIHTQEKDEKLRRSRRKQHDQKLKNDFAKKMANKVRFGQVVAEEAQDEDNDEDVSSDVDEEDETGPKLVKSSSLTKLDRLQRFLMKSLERGGAAPTEKKKKSSRALTHLPSLSDEEEDAENGRTAGKASSSVSEAAVARQLAEDYRLIFTGRDSAAVSKSTTVSERDIKGDESGDESDGEGDGKKTSNKQARKEVDYHALFVDHAQVASSTSTKKNPKFQLVRRDIFNRHEYSMYITKPHDQEWAQFVRSPLSTVQSVPGVHKLWQSLPYEVTLNRFQKLVLPSVLMYQDVFLEGRDMQNNDTMLESTLMHSLFHVVKSRYGGGDWERCMRGRCV